MIRVCDRKPDCSDAFDGYISTYGGLNYWCIYASLGPEKLNYSIVMIDVVLIIVNAATLLQAEYFCPVIYGITQYAKCIKYQNMFMEC